MTKLANRITSLLVLSVSFFNNYMDHLTILYGPLNDIYELTMVMFNINCPKCKRPDVEPVDHETYKCNLCNELFKISNLKYDRPFTTSRTSGSWTITSVEGSGSG